MDLISGQVKMLTPVAINLCGPWMWNIRYNKSYIIELDIKARGRARTKT